MESNLPLIAKRVWSVIRVAFFMLRRGISKGKLMKDLNMILKRRGKLATKAIGNIMFHHHHHNHHDGGFQIPAAREYEFSCSNTPNYFFTRHRNNPFITRAHAPPTQDDDVGTVNAVKAVLEMLNNEAMVEAASPALPGFGKSPKVRQLRVTDSPFPLKEAEGDKDNQVDKAAEDFIKRFYKELKKQG